MKSGFKRLLSRFRTLDTQNNSMVRTIWTIEQTQHWNSTTSVLNRTSLSALALVSLFL